MENLGLYARFSAVPENAKKKISGGKLNGKTDINPMWRIKSLTEAFGPCGIGWTTRVVDRWTETADGESAAWVLLELRFRDPDTGEWSEPVQGMGGSKQNGKGQGDGINDEAFKMAETDAISVCCKKLGMGADVYWDADRTKYTNPRAATADSTASSAPKKPVIVKDGDLWGKAISYCVTNGLSATDLTAYYSIDAKTVKALQSAIDEAKGRA